MNLVPHRNLVPCHINTADVYAPPVVRAPSPTDSLSTEYGPDLGGSENDLSDADFDNFVTTRLDLSLGRLTAGGSRELPPVRIPIPKFRDKNEEQLIINRMMLSLRRKVQEVEREELYNAHVMQKFNTTAEVQSSENDVDAIMRSMIGPSAARTSIRKEGEGPLAYGTQPGCA